jgi:hypothetical protein
MEICQSGLSSNQYPVLLKQKSKGEKSLGTSSGLFR